MKKTLNEIPAGKPCHISKHLQQIPHPSTDNMTASKPTKTTAKTATTHSRKSREPTKKERKQVQQDLFKERWATQYAHTLARRATKESCFFAYQMLTDATTAIEYEIETKKPYKFANLGRATSYFQMLCDSLSSQCPKPKGVKWNRKEMMEALVLCKDLLAEHEQELNKPLR